VAPSVFGNAAPVDVAALVGLVRLEWPGGRRTVAFPALVRRHRLAPLAYVLASRAGDEAASAFEAEYGQAVARQLVVTSVLRSLAGTLEGIPWAVVKGPVLSREAHPVVGVRSYEDVDVLVAPEALRRVLGRLLAAGWRHLDTNHPLLVARMPGELHLRSREGVVMDLHWSLFNDVDTRAAFPVAVCELLRRRCLADGLGVARLQDEDVLVHLCLHAAVSGADRLLWLVDVDQWVRNHPLDWSVFAARVARARARSAVGTVLARARTSLDTPVPAEVLSSMPAAWGRTVALLDRVQPVPAVAADASWSKLVARAARDRSLNSFRVLVAHSARGVAARLRQAPSSYPTLTEIDEDPELLDAYLEAVERLGHDGSRAVRRSGVFPSGPP
jgi:hypothetical protein